ncbi:MAG TPA: hypothetical protein VNX65_02530 [Patescibacteria group bacterium]|jgi:hypothetical protein|nr:hypothetical protein [Patescibacteria group bacterium]
MTNKDLLQDLKQFITVTVSQQIAVVIGNMATKDDLKQLRSDFEQFDEKLDAIQDALGETLQDQEFRLHKLESCSD